MEHRTRAREANQKFGFRDYQIRDKRAIKLMQLSFLAWTIERFMQLSFLAWTIILVAKATGKDFKTVIREMKLSEILDEARLLYFVEIGDDHRFERSLNLIPLVLGKN